MRCLGAFRVGPDHPALPGHFPGRPVVPGVVLLDEMLVLLRAAHPDGVTGLPRVKFLRPVLPDEVVTVLVTAQKPGRIGILASVEGQAVLRGSVALAAA